MMYWLKFEVFIGLLSKKLINGTNVEFVTWIHNPSSGEHVIFFEKSLYVSV